MSLIQKIIDIGLRKGVKQAQLYGPAKACFEDPARGFTVINKYAPLVVRDCAYLAKQYIPVFVFNEVSDCVLQLRSSSVTELEVDEFIIEMEKQESSLSKGHRELYLSILEAGEEYLITGDAPTEELINDADIDYNNVYGDYSNYSQVENDIQLPTEFVGTPAEKLKMILIP